MPFFLKKKPLIARQKANTDAPIMNIEGLKDLARRKAMAIVGTAMTSDEATRQQIAKNLELEMIEPDGDKKED
jgi:hypothetical protein